jgi:hypothetical protein
MKRLVLIISLLTAASGQAVEGKYFSLKQRVQEWLADASTQEALKDDKTKAKLVELLEEFAAQGYTDYELSDDCDQTCDGHCGDLIELTDEIVNSTMDVVNTNASWVKIREAQLEDQIYELEPLMKEARKDEEPSPEIKAKMEAIEKHLIERYGSMQEFERVRDLKDKEGVTEAATYLLDLIKAIR